MVNSSGGDVVEMLTAWQGSACFTHIIYVYEWFLDSILAQHCATSSCLVVKRGGSTPFCWMDGLLSLPPPTHPPSLLSPVLHPLSLPFFFLQYCWSGGNQRWNCRIWREAILWLTLQENTTSTSKCFMNSSCTGATLPANHPGSHPTTDSKENRFHVQVNFC